MSAAYLLPDLSVRIEGEFAMGTVRFGIAPAPSHLGYIFR
jgi:hypothetical protein